MPLPARNSSRRRKKNPDNEERAAGERPADEVMAPTRMKLRVRRGDAAVASGGGGPVDGPAERTREGGRSSSRRKNSSKTSGSGATAATASSSSPPTTSSGSVRAVRAAEEASPDSKCPICLDRFNNLAYLDHCLHRFCFPCIQEWSHNKAECPLCKQPFASILHSVRAEDDFKEYTLRPPPPANNSVAATVAMVAAMASAAAARNDHSMRLMLRRHRASEGGESAPRRRRRGRGSEERAGGVWELFLDPPPLNFPPLTRRLTVSNLAEDSEEADGARGVDHGAIFDQLTRLRGAAASLASNSQALRQLTTRLTTRRRLQREGGAVKRLREGQMLNFRRMLYRCGVRVRGVAGVNGGQQRDVTAEGFHQCPAHLNRLRPWLRRELRVMYGSSSSLVDIVQNIIVARLALHGLENTLNLEEDLQPFLRVRTQHFLHELVSFARSPLIMDDYDAQAVYEPPAVELDGLSSSSDGSSVIAISEEEERRGRSEGAASIDIDDIQGSSLSLTGWDDETPGPSYSTASCSLAPPLSISPAPFEPENEGGDRREEEVEECLIVGYKKPIAERTPELVQLSSDTDEGAEKKKEEVESADKAPPLPSPTPSSSYLPVIPPSTSSGLVVEQEAVQKDEEVWRRRSWSGSSDRSGKSVCERQRGRRKRRKKRSRRYDDGPRRSGTFGNPNRSIYPPMMRRRSPPPPFDSSAASSCSPLPSSPDLRCVQVSPLTSPLSSPSCSSSPQRTPTPSRSPAERAHHTEKPSGKRKYKSRHLDSSARDPTWRLNGGRQRERRKERRKRREKSRKEGQQENGALQEESRKRSREDRSPSVEIIYEGTVTSQPPGHKRRRKRQRRARHSSPPVIITLDSDSSDDIIRKRHSTSSSPLSSQQTIDFSDLPPLPLVHSAGVGGALDAQIGELPAEILDRGSEGSDVETAGPSAGQINISDNSDVDVENLEDEDGRTSPGDCQNHAEVPGGHGDVSPSDKNLLRTILCDLNQISAKQELSQNHRSSLSSDTRTKSPQEDSPDETKHDWTSSLSFDFQTSSGSAPSLAPHDVPPLLRRASPVRSYNRNTPPPLKHKDAGSPQRTVPRDLMSYCSSDLDPGGVVYPQTIPPIETLQAHLRKVIPLFPPPETPHSSDLSSVSRGDAIKTTSPDCLVSPVDLHPPISSGPDWNHTSAETRSPKHAVDPLSFSPSSGGQLDRRTAVNHAALSPSPVRHPDTFHPSKSSFERPCPSDSAPHPSECAPQLPQANHLMRDVQIFEDLQNLFRVRSPEPGP